MSKKSIFTLLGLPQSFGTLLLTFFFILTIAPYFPGVDFGIFKIPNFASTTTRFLKIIGPVLLIVQGFLLLPIWRDRKTSSQEIQAKQRFIDSQAAQKILVTINGIVIPESTIGGEIPAIPTSMKKTHTGVPISVHLRNVGETPFDPITHIYLFTQKDSELSPNIIFIQFVASPQDSFDGLTIQYHVCIHRDIPPLPVGSVEGFDIALSFGAGVTSCLVISC